MRKQIQGKKLQRISFRFCWFWPPFGCHQQVILGHHFVDYQAKSIPTTKQHCDNCTGIIWSVVQASYICVDCNFCVHHKCVENVIRVCANVIASERKEPLDEICPEIGLSFQQYECTECHASLSFSKYSNILCIANAHPKFGQINNIGIATSQIEKSFTNLSSNRYRFSWMVLLLGIA